MMLVVGDVMIMTEYNCVVCGNKIDVAVMKGVFFDWESLLQLHVCSPRCYSEWSMAGHGIVMPEAPELDLPEFVEPDDSMRQFDNLKKAVQGLLPIIKSMNQRMELIEHGISILNDVVTQHTEYTRRYLDIMDKQLRMLEGDSHAEIPEVKK
jgi:hypothetical protein